MEPFLAYGHAIVAMAATALFGLVINPLTAVAKMNAGQVSGATPAEDYGDKTYRFNRAYLNLTEIMGFFVAATVAAILAGADPTWVNWLASIFFVARLVHFVVHYGGIGPMNFGPRTIVFTVGWACCIVLAALAIFAIL
ncbi:MAG: MAPEG family protein [Rhodobacter sp.]|nr:MAPEG family protein [Rhodobacter sp.]